MRPYPDASLLVASALSITLHCAALITLGSDPYTRQASPKAAPFTASLRQVPQPSPASAPHSAVPSSQFSARPKPHHADRAPISDRPSDKQAIARAPLSHQGTTDEAPTNTTPEVPFFPIDVLSRPPVLLTQVGPEDWPPNPGAPSGRLLIQVDIGADGHVVRTTPVCTPYTCHAAAIYANFIFNWSFSPAEILGHPVPSRISVEIELENPIDRDLELSPLTPPQPRQ